MKKRIAILGSTGSIGKQALEVVDQHPEQFTVEVLTANNKADLLIEQAIKYKPNAVVIGHDCLYDKLMDALDPYDIKVYVGEEAIEQVVEMDSIDMVLMALVGFAGLKPTVAAIKAKKPIALANKECLVVAGEHISKLVIENRVELIPVDSEHSAIFQCLSGENPEHIEKVILTASGGPFRNTSLEELNSVSVADALNHPNWDMGNKITIDSATLMNKGLEVIEAKWLFGLEPEQIEVVIHPQSIIHSMVQFRDGSIKAQMGLPDMRLPIVYALGFPERMKNDFPRFNFNDYGQLTFEAPDFKKFRNLALAFEALKTGGNMPCALNAANEIAVQLFLNGKTGFLNIPEIIEATMQKVGFIQNPSFEDYFETDREARRIAIDWVQKNNKTI
ncbi:MAG TPA: 1-deoxy-D-xylulose-5-phosphate reductoisomerase [Bacteroidales bacterium]|nr:1-deoxy-D-xylulose-5-phosphate reductoisomerase [Bacteroidales bacterium]